MARACRARPFIRPALLAGRERKKTSMFCFRNKSKLVKKKPAPFKAYENFFSTDLTPLKKRRGQQNHA